jgi:hypothetical protein
MGLAAFTPRRDRPNEIFRAIITIQTITASLSRVKNDNRDRRLYMSQARASPT